MNNKIVLITDQHFQARKTSKQFHDYFLEFYENVFFPYLIENDIKTVIDLGDTFDNRNFLDPAAIEWAKVNYYDRLKQLNIQHHVVVGNHTSKLKNTNKISSVDLILREYDNITVYKDPTEVIINGLKILFLPWINKDNELETLQKIHDTDATVAMGHLELNGFSPYVGHVMEDGRDPNVLHKFEKVFSGHYHTRSDNGKIFYIGNPYELYFNDVGDRRGFAIFDPENLVHDYVDNPYKMHYQLIYDSCLNFEDVSQLQNKIVKIVVKKIDDFTDFEETISSINRVNPTELKIIQAMPMATVEEFEEIESEDTISILNRYVDEDDVNYDKSRVKSILYDVYKEVLQGV